MIALHECGFPLNPMERAAAEDAEGGTAITGGTGAGKPTPSPPWWLISWRQEPRPAASSA